MAIRFRAREFHHWSRRSFMERVVRAMIEGGQVPGSYWRRVRESFTRLDQEDARLRRLFR